MGSCFAGPVEHFPAFSVHRVYQPGVLKHLEVPARRCETGRLPGALQ